MAHFTLPKILGTTVAEEVAIRARLPFLVQVKNTRNTVFFDGGLTSEEVRWCEENIGPEALADEVYVKRNHQLLSDAKWAWFEGYGPWDYFYFQSETTAIEFKLRFG